VSFIQLPHYAAIYRQASCYGLSAAEGQQPLRARRHGMPIGVLPSLDSAPESVDWPTILRDYDTLWLFRPPDAYRAYLAPRCAVAETSGEIVIYRQCRIP
jgi:hypothetical protein